MRFALNDTIAAPATPPGSSALAVLRVSGPRAVERVSRVFSHPDKLTSAAGYQALHGYIRDGGEVIDEVVCLVFRQPHSYTGEDLVEITGHGNPDLSSRILQLLLKDCRLAEPGEFTFRAFMNHKLDLIQAEAVNDLVRACTAKAEAAALNQLKGSISKEIEAVIAELSDCRTRFELSIDFADQDLPGPDLGAEQARVENIRQKLQTLIAGGRQGRILRDGFSVCLCGAPNVGKSSVFNKFLEESRAIVTSVPGTTRDYLQEWLSLDGFPVRLIDTAGLREGGDEVERIGIRRTRELIREADLIIMLTDPDTLERECCALDDATSAKTVCVLNKIDLLGFESLPDEQDWQAFLKGSRFNAKLPPRVRLHPCSAFLEDGIKAVRDQAVSRIAGLGIEPSSVLVTNSRHLACLQRAADALDKALTAIAASAGYEFIAFDLIEAVSALSEITGAVTADDLLESIFSNFCIGK